MSVRWVEWAAAARPREGESESGDRCLVQAFRNGVLVADVDGLGHGTAAATAAERTMAVLEQFAHESPIALLRRCHESLRCTRGVVMSLASFDAQDNTMTWAGVGDVLGALLRADLDVRPRKEVLLPRDGVVGHHLPPLSASILDVHPGDTLVLATDGLREELVDGLSVNEPPQRMADRVLAEYGKVTDDALVLVARYLGGSL